MIIQNSPSLKLAVALFWLNTAIWLILGVVSLVQVGESGDTSQGTAMIIALLMFGNAFGMLIIGAGIAKRIRLFFYPALVFLGVNILLTITDEFGIWDLVTLVIDLVLVGLLVTKRAIFTGPGQR